VYARVDALAGALASALGERGYAVAAPPRARAGIVSVAAPDPAAVRDALAERRVYVEGREGWVRASPHFYNTPADVEAFVDALSSVLAPGGPASSRVASPGA
jgi:selenocysteine lyase/cysteine desulfurase